MDNTVVVESQMDNTVVVKTQQMDNMDNTLVQAYTNAMTPSLVCEPDTKRSNWSCSSAEIRELLKIPMMRPKPKSLASKRERNKISASKYRQKRKRQALEMERKMYILTNLVTLQKNKLYSLHRENKALKMRVETIRSVLCSDPEAASAFDTKLNVGENHNPLGSLNPTVSPGPPNPLACTTPPSPAQTATSGQGLLTLPMKTETTSAEDQFFFSSLVNCQLDLHATENVHRTDIVTDSVCNDGIPLREQYPFRGMTNDGMNDGMIGSMGMCW